MFRRRRPTEERDRGYLDGGIAEFCFFESGLDSSLRENGGCPAPHLWIADQVRNDVIGVVLLSPSPLIPLPSRGYCVGGVVLLLYARPLTSGLRIKSAMTVRCAGLGRCVASFCGYCLEASTSLRHGRIQQVLSVACPCPSGLRIKSAMT